MTTMATQALKDSLAQFQKTVNANLRLPPILKGWEPDIVLEPSDTSTPVVLQVRNAKIADIVDGSSAAPHVIRIQGTTDILRTIFDGTTNPSEALLDGGIAVVGSDKDQVKLDAISLVIWGL